MEKVAVRLATFASNVDAVGNVPSRFPSPNEFMNAAKRQSVKRFVRESNDREVLAKKILKLAGKQQGLFYYINSREYGGNNQKILDDDALKSQKENANEKEKKKSPTTWMKDFWVVSDQEKELFSRLACIEAMRNIEAIDKAGDKEQNPWLIIAYRALASAGACAFWFQGSWIDMLVSAVLALMVAYVGTSLTLSKQERLISEIVSSFLVGLTAALIALRWPDDTCFAAMAISGVLDILQGFRVVYSIVEIMSKHTVAGSADLLEGILFTGLIAYSLRYGQHLAGSILGDPVGGEFLTCSHGINEYWYFLFVPLAALSWSGLFNPSTTRDLFLMGYHGILAFVFNFGLSKAGVTAEANNFLSALAVSASAGILSRFTGRQAIGNTVAGLYVLLPGAYLVTSLYSTTINGSFFTDIIQRAVVIGIGGWTGSMLCSPTLLGTTKGLMNQQLGYKVNSRLFRRSGSNNETKHRRDDSSLPDPATMFYF